MAVKFGFFCGDNNCVADYGALCTKRKFLDDDNDVSDAALIIADTFSCHNNNSSNIRSNDGNENNIKCVSSSLSLAISDNVHNNWFYQCINYICLISYAIISFVCSGCITLRKRCVLFAIFCLLLQLNGLFAVTVAATNVGSGIIASSEILSNQCKYRSFFLFLIKIDVDILINLKI